jgi:hypothetical protein
MVRMLSRRTRWGLLLCVLVIGGGAALYWQWQSAREALFVQLLDLHEPSVLSLGAYAGCAIRADESLACWGTLRKTGFYLPPPPAGTFRHVSVGIRAACAIRTDHTLSCWGDFSAPAPEGRFVDVKMNGIRVCAIRLTGTILCWAVYDSDPSPLGWLPNNTGPVYDMNLALHYECVLKVDGTRICGSDFSGVVALKSPRDTFTHLASGAGDMHACGIHSDHTLSCWGGDGYGQATPPAGTFSQVSAGAWHTCGIQLDHTLACWGDNMYGQVTPPQGTFVAVSAGMYETCAITTEGALTCWGSQSGPGKPEAQSPLPTGPFGPPRNEGVPAP